MKASRIKPGKEQKARLGHYLKKLSCANAYYIDVTDADGIGTAHTYFKGDCVERNDGLKLLFSDMFNGNAIDRQLTYHSDTNTYSFTTP